MHDTEQFNQAYSDSLLIFAEFFKFPEYEFYENIRSGEVDRQIKKYSTVAGTPVNASFREVLGTYDDLVSAFNNCFLGIKIPFAPPVESVYKIWTTDTSFQIPLKHQKGYLLGDPALHVRHILDKLGLVIPREYEFMPDHLTIILELCAYLYQQGLVVEAKQFKSDHLDWLGDYQTALTEIDGSEIYQHVVTKLNEFLN